jgi:hypothetical protein
MDLSRVIIFTPDVGRLVDFYIASFGLGVIGKRDRSWTELKAGDCNIAFHYVDEHDTSRPGWIKIVFGSDDIEGEKRRLETLGITMSDIVEYEGIKLCDGRDPDGNSFQISSRGI